MSIVKLNNRSIKDVTAFGSLSSFGNLVHIATQTASSSSSINFTSGIDSTYKEYIFYFVDIHPATDNTGFMFNMSIDGGSNYNITKTTTNFRAFNDEGSGSGVLRYETTSDLAQSTAFQDMTREDGSNDDDHNCVGYLHLFNPSDTTFVKHFIITTNSTHEADYSHQNFIAGYANTTSAINAVQFKASSGNIDSGQILLFGLS